MSHLEHVIEEFLEVNQEYSGILWDGSLTIFLKSNKEPFSLTEFNRYTKTRLLLEKLEAQCTIASVKDEIQSWLDKQGQDKCHYYPEIFQKIAELLQIKNNLVNALPPEEEFQSGCDKYRKDLYCQ
jgi:hypothetical protein